MGDTTRRGAIKLVAAGGVLAAAVPAAGRGAERADSDAWAGEWLMEGDAARPCAVFRHGAVLLVVNEQGSIGSARVTGEKTLVVLKGDGWQVGLTAELHDGGKTIVWHNGPTEWKRR